MPIPLASKIKTITDMRENALDLLNQAQKEENPTIIVHRNNPKAVLLSIDRYNHLMDLLEDYLAGELASELEIPAKNKEDYFTLEEVAKKFNIKL